LSPNAELSPSLHRERLIEPAPRWVGFELAELWEFRELVFFLTWRDIKARYKQTALGVAWAVLQPVMTMIVFTLFFGRLGTMPSDGVPYPLFSFAGLVPWSLLVYGLNQAANSLVTSQNLITKVYFPRLIIPIATVLSGVIDMGIAFAILIGMMVWYGIAPTLHVLWAVPLMGLAATTALGIGSWLAALNIQYRDVRYAVPFLTQLWLLATPIAYPSSMLSEPWRTVYAVNPMVTVVDGFRYALLGTGGVPLSVAATSTVAALVLLVSGVLYFRQMEESFADLV
jgi:lipopolysaccharide transport system permease protein